MLLFLFILNNLAQVINSEDVLKNEISTLLLKEMKNIHILL